MNTSFAKLHQARACVARYKHLAKKLGGVTAYGRDTPIPLVYILDEMGWDDALWSLRATLEPCDKQARLLACDFAEHVLPLFEAVFPKDGRPRAAIATARRFAAGGATETELNAAGFATEYATDRYVAAWSAAEYAAESTRHAAESALWSADRYVAAGFAAEFACDAAADAAWENERRWQEKKFRECLEASCITWNKP